jgi:4-diphosphocytidyl-2-C-methyl-D-erythritol kinase
VSSQRRAEARSGGVGPVEIEAAAKLTLSLRVVGVRSDGYHLLESEMVSLDLADTLRLGPGDGLTVTAGSTDDATGTGKPDGAAGVSVALGPDNLVVRALRAVGRRADVELVKRIPAGAGLGGGSADAAAVLRWAGCRDVDVALGLGADVPFCLSGGRAMVRGVGEDIEALPFEDRLYTLLLLPFGTDTAAVYRAWDELARRRDGRTSGDGGNDLEAAALAVDGRLARWKRVLAERSGRTPRLAGSGSTWFVEGALTGLGPGDPVLRSGNGWARLVEVRTVPPLP